MGVFDDKKFEQLDWISQATEPIDSELNEVLSLIPEEIQVDFNIFRRVVGASTYLDIGKVVSYLIGMYATKFDISYGQRGLLESCFKIEMDDEVTLDFERKVIDGDIRVIKTVFTMDEKVLQNQLGQEGISSISYCQMYKTDAMNRANEIMDLLGKCEDGIKTRSERKKRIMLIRRMHELFKNNEWNIRDTELANKIGQWIAGYIQDGNLAGFSNFCRLKVMTHKNQPIYSMEEIN